jgi:hypothetical protein
MSSSQIATGQFTYDWSSITIQQKKRSMGQGVWITWRWNSPRVQGGLLEGKRVLGSSGTGNASDNDVESNEAHVGSCEEEARNLITRNLNWLLSWKWELCLQRPCLLLAPQHYQQVWKLRTHNFWRLQSFMTMYQFILCNWKLWIYVT